jgi:adenosine deaminase
MMEKVNPMTLSRDVLSELPKTELHVHLDCCLSFDVVSKLRPGITRDVFANEFVGPTKYKDLAEFLHIIDNSLALMQSTEGLQLITEDLFRQFERDNVIYAEIRFAPLLHLRKGLTPKHVVKTVEETVSRMIEETGIEARIILCTLRHFSEEQSMITAKLVEEFKHSTVTALDIGADEAGFPIDNHVSAFRFAKEQGLHCTAHAGEARGADSVWETLKFFEPTRIGHGVRSIEDPRLVDQLIRRNIHLEVCPSCNIQIDVFDTYEGHPVDRLLEAGVSVGINTDTRTITDISLTEEYLRLHNTFGWSKEHFLACNRNALKASFLPDTCKKDLLTQLKDKWN